MIKIGNNSTPEPSKLIGTPSSVPAGGLETEASAFSKAMLQTQEALRQETMDKLMAMIDLQAVRLQKSPVPAEVAVYRELIRKFVKEATEKMAKVDRRIDRRNRPMLLVREVDKKLAELTDKVLAGQAKPIEILALVNEIRGLLVDFLV